MSATSFSAEDYEVIREGCRRSADAALEGIMRGTTGIQRGSRVVDVGCGEGWWGKAFADQLGCEVLGLDGAGCEPLIPFREVDLERPLPLKDLGEFDLAVCLEVAEHLPPGRADSFIADLCELAPLILFSAAIPGQGGMGHLNEQWPGYWVERFAIHGFRCSGDLRWRIWDDDRIENWYRQNLILATSRADVYEFLRLSVQPVVHPVLYDARRA